MEDTRIASCVMGRWSPEYLKSGNALNRGTPPGGTWLICSAFLKGSLSLLRFHQILRPNKSFNPSLLLSFIDLILCYSNMISNSCLFPVVGRPFANTICIILVVIRMKVLAEKRKVLTDLFYVQENRINHVNKIFYKIIIFDGEFIAFQLCL
jgi:hypothetical protein